MPLTIQPIHAFRDNYIWAIHYPNQQEIAVVDPGDANPVLDYLQKNNLSLQSIILTHHHWDHSGGITILSKKFPNIPIYGPKNEPVPGLTHLVTEGDTLNLHPDFTLKVLSIPGHTLGHVAYVGDHKLFCGDTLFSCGCGRVFEGTPEQMLASLDKLAALAGDIEVYCGHEYTLANIAFAKRVEPDNADLLAREKAAIACLDQHKPTLPSLLATELRTNPFLRCDQTSVIKAVQQQYQSQQTDRVTIFTQLREWKNKVA